MSTTHKFYRLLALFVSGDWRLDVSTGPFWLREGPEVETNEYAGFRTEEGGKTTRYVFLNLDTDDPEVSEFLRLTGYKNQPISSRLAYWDKPPKDPDDE